MKKKTVLTSHTVVRVRSQAAHLHSAVGNVPWLFFTSRRLRKDLGPIYGYHFKWLSYREMRTALFLQKNWQKLEAQTSLTFLLGSLLLVMGSIAELQNLDLFKITFVLGSAMFFIGALIQFWQSARAWYRNKKAIVISFSLGLTAAFSAKLGTIFYNLNSISDWLDLDTGVYLEQLFGPEFFFAGSFLFLISGIAHYAEIGHGRTLFIEKNHLAWWSCVSHIFGALLFCLSALYGLQPIYGWPINMISKVDSSTLCLAGSLLFVFMSLCLLAECSENEVVNSRHSKLEFSDHINE